MIREVRIYQHYAGTGLREEGLKYLSKALENLQKAETMYQEMGMEYCLRRTQSALAKLQG